jgi:hypothetical protein
MEYNLLDNFNYKYKAFLSVFYQKKALKSVKIQNKTLIYVYILKKAFNNLIYKFMFK